MERQEDTVLEYQRSKEPGSTGSSMVVDFYLGYNNVKQVQLDTITKERDFDLHTLNLELVPRWDSIMLTITGTDGAAFEVFRIKEKTEIVFDLVARKGCDTVWLDGKPYGGTKGCYKDTVFEQELFAREVKLDTAGNFFFESCNCETECGGK